MSEYTTEQIKLIVRECHKRGIRVLTYFGSEMSALSPEWSGTEARDVMVTDRGSREGGWYRVPYQRDFVLCYASEWKERLVDGIVKIMDTCHTDGVYLDGTAQPRLCFSTAHGCGWHDGKGRLHGSYPLQQIRGLFRKLFAEVEARGGMISVHSFACVNFMALPYIHQSWYGEDLQFDYCHGKLDDFPLEHFRAAYTGRNMGVPVELIAYENRPVWTFENAAALGMIHGILPRPNDIEGPLELMSGIWPVVDAFPVAQSEWKPYWNNGAEASNPCVKLSYYRYVAPDGQVMLLVFCANITSQPLKGITLKFDEPVNRFHICAAGHPVTDTEKAAGSLRFAAYDFAVILAR